MIKGFWNFIKGRNVIGLAVGIVVGVAFGAVVNSLVSGIIMPPIGLALGKMDFANLFVVLREGTVAGPYTSLAAAQEAGAITISYGAFINTLVNFIIIAAVIFFLIVRPMKKMDEMMKKEEEEEPTTKSCPYCLSTIPVRAMRCPNCTSQLELKRA